MGHCREIASTDRVVEQFASSRDSTIRVIGLSGFLGGALGGCGGGWGGRGGGGGGVHSFLVGFSNDFQTAGRFYLTLTQTYVPKYLCQQTFFQ